MCMTHQDTMLIAEVYGSGTKPYQLKQHGDSFSCSCPAWRNQSLPTDKRTCKHLKSHRGESVELARINGAKPEAAKPVKIEPPVLLAESYDAEKHDPTGWWVSEKLDGVRAYWTGTEFLSRNGNRFDAPASLTSVLPNTPLDGELWIARKDFNRTSGIVRSSSTHPGWQEVKYVVFDAPAVAGGFEVRIAAAKKLLDGKSSRVEVLAQWQSGDGEMLKQELLLVEQLGGEGLMLRKPGSLYEPRRSFTLLKVKSFFDAEATVLGYEAGKGKHKDRMGALVCLFPNGVKFTCGTGFTDKERVAPPAVGATVTVKYQELFAGGQPRFPTFVGVRYDK